MCSSFSDFNKDIKEIDFHLRKISEKYIAEQPRSTLFDHVFQEGGKRLRPLICLLSFEMINTKIRTNLSYIAACALEIIHNASLLIDDLFDHDVIRRNKKSFYLEYSTFETLAITYSLSSYAYELATRTKKSEIIQEINHITQKMSKALFLEQEIREAKQFFSIEKIIELIDVKTTPLFEGATVIGSLLGNTTVEEIEDMRTFGKFFGRAFQLRDDYLAITSNIKNIGKSSVKTDIENRIQNYIVIKTYEKINSEQKYIFEQYYLHKKDYSIETIRNIIVSSGALKSTKDLISTYVDLASDILSKYPESHARKKLIKITRLLKIEK